MNVFELAAKLSLDTSEYKKGLSDASKETENLKKQLGNAGKNAAQAAGVIATVAGAGYKLATQTADNADQIDKMSQKLGLSAKAYQEWSYVMELSGTSIDSMSAGMKTLTNKMDDAIAGGDKSAEMFKKLGISTSELSNMSREDVFAAVIKGFQGMEDNAERAALANDLLGRSGQELTPLFNTTAEETDALIQKLNEMGGVMSDDAVKSGAQLNDALTTMKAGFAGAVNSIGAELLPVFTEFINKVNDFVAEGGLQKIVNTIKTLAPVIEAAVVAFVAFKTALAISSLIQALTTIVGGATTAFAALNAVMLLNPITLIVGLIVGLIAIFATLIATNENFREGFVNAWNAIKDTINEVVSNIVLFFTQTIPNALLSVIEFFVSIPKKALQWGKDLIDNFINGIKERIQKLKDAVTAVAQTVKDFLGFSEPDKGPLSNFHTYAPDMMELFAKGIADNERVVTNQISKSFDFGNVGTIGYTTTSASTAQAATTTATNTGTAQASAQNVQVNVTLEGDAKKLFNVIRDENKKYTMTTGKNAFA